MEIKDISQLIRDLGVPIGILIGILYYLYQLYIGCVKDHKERDDKYQKLTEQNIQTKSELTNAIKDMAGVLKVESESRQDLVRKLVERALEREG